MSKKPYVPAHFDNNRESYLLGWKDAEEGEELGANGAGLTGYAKFAYEAGYSDFHAKNAKGGGGPVTRPVSAWARAEIAGYVAAMEYSKAPCPFTDGPLRDAWHEGFARGKARAETLAVKVLP